MANILLNEFDQIRQESLRSKLQRQDHHVWTANHLSEVNVIINDVPIDVLILDLDDQNLDDIMEFAGLWRGAFIVFQASVRDFSLDFRHWIADKCVTKCEQGSNVMQAVAELLQTNSFSTNKGEVRL